MRWGLVMVFATFLLGLVWATRSSLMDFYRKRCPPRLCVNDFDGRKMLTTSVVSNCNHRNFQRIPPPLKATARPTYKRLTRLRYRLTEAGRCRGLEFSRLCYTRYLLQTSKNILMSDSGGCCAGIVSASFSSSLNAPATVSHGVSPAAKSRSRCQACQLLR